MNPPTPIEQSDPELAEHLRRIANGESPVQGIRISPTIRGLRGYFIEYKAGGRWWNRFRKLPTRGTGPYDPCDCGSGKKRKFCCGR